MAYGTPESLEDVEADYTHIRHGRKSSEEALKMYKAIGGISPLAKITKEQAHKLTDSMNKMFIEYEFFCYLGLKHIARFRSFI
ncbi:ferrochelatase [Bacillus cereus]|uniref:Ferrochelatase n=1 Tax=Bacillus cereus TaxID=1396 RepID=A0A1S9V6X0_BACCE|nr:ferrochelatase [Bacillus cereus]